MLTTLTLALLTGAGALDAPDRAAPRAKLEPIGPVVAERANPATSRAPQWMQRISWRGTPRTEAWHEGKHSASPSTVGAGNTLSPTLAIRAPEAHATPRGGNAVHRDATLLERARATELFSCRPRELALNGHTSLLLHADRSQQGLVGRLRLERGVPLFERVSLGVGFGLGYVDEIETRWLYAQRRTTTADLRALLRLDWRASDSTTLHVGLGASSRIVAPQHADDDSHRAAIWPTVGLTWRP